MKKSIVKHTARIKMLSEIMSFPTIRGGYWTSGMSNSKVIIGDLVALDSAPATEWYLSWVHEVIEDRYLLESVETGKMCWWSNIGISYYDREVVKDRPTWKWEDSQFTFYKKWLKVCNKQDYWTVAALPIFKDKDVVLNTRQKFEGADPSKAQEFKNWKKLRIKDMEEFFKPKENEETK